MKMKRYRYTLTCLALLVGLVLLVGCVPGAMPSPPVPVAAIPAALPSIADVVARVQESVVTIDTETVTYDSFNRPVTEGGSGSGWVIDKNGTIITNNHVVEGAQKVTVTFTHHQSFIADKIFADQVTDLAIVKINASNLPPARIGDAGKLRLGDWVIAIGNPLGMGISVKQGIVSRLGVQLVVAPGHTLYNLIETSAAINPGNSGGALFNMAGEVVGITSLKIATAGIEGMGYAISINHALPIIDTLLKNGCITRAWLGATTFTVDEGVARRYGLPAPKGALVTEVAADSPAERASIQTGDIIIGFRDKEIATAEQLSETIDSSQIGQTVTVSLWRDKTRMDVKVTLIEHPGCEFKKR